MLRSKGEKIFQVFNYFLLGLIGVICILPFIHVAAKSMSDSTAVIAGKVGLVPIDFTLKSYNYVLFYTQFFTALKNSVLVSLLGTILALFIAAFAAYPLSKPGFKGRKFFLALYIIDMYFSAGIIPSYMLMKTFNLLDTLASMVIPMLVIPFYMLVIKSYYEGLPESLEESAKIDGANDFTILTQIIFPLSKPVFATVALFYAVQYWNNFFNPMMYITKQELQPITIYLYSLIRQAESPNAMANADMAMTIEPSVMRATTIIVSTIPILLVYPFLQKYLIKGLVVGSVKG